jgi:hypothetical protein
LCGVQSIDGALVFLWLWRKQKQQQQQQKTKKTKKTKKTRQQQKKQQQAVLSACCGPERSAWRFHVDLFFSLSSRFTRIVFLPFTPRSVARCSWIGSCSFLAGLPYTPIRELESLLLPSG